MRKRVFGKKLGRNTNTREALFRSLIRSMVEYGSISTTKAKATAISPEIDKMMRYLRTDTVSNKRAVLALLGNDRVTTDKLYERYLSLAKGRSSGFTKTKWLPSRKGDNASMVKIEWSGAPAQGEAAEKKSEKKGSIKEVKK